MKSNKKQILILATVIGLSLSSAAQARLYLRGADMVYDDVLDVTWLKDANYAQTSGYDADGRMTWSVANIWAAGLTVGGYTDWRLPDVKPINNSAFDYNFSSDGSTDQGYNITSTQSEMAYMFYENLGNMGEYDTSGAVTGCNGFGGSDGSGYFYACLTNAGLFDNLESDFYWSAVEYAPNTDRAWVFSTRDGDQFDDGKYPWFHAWAVRSGDVAVVPVPAAVWLMGSALLGLTGFSRKR